MGPELDDKKLFEMRLDNERERRIDAGEDVDTIIDIENFVDGRFKKTRGRKLLQADKCLVKYDEAKLTNEEREMMAFGSTL